MAEGVLQDAWLDEKRFLENYQFLRNLIYLGSKPGNRCFFIHPAGNKRFSETEAMIEAALRPEFSKRAKVVHLEELVGSLQRLPRQLEAPRLTHHINAFAEKYLGLRS